MSRHGYVDDCDYIELYRGQVASAIRGRRGQAFLRRLRDTLDAMPQKRLVAGWLHREDGEVCALGAEARARSIETPPDVDIEDDDAEGLVVAWAAGAFDIAGCLAAEIMYLNDEASCSPEERWRYLRRWLDEKIKESAK